MAALPPAGAAAPVVPPDPLDHCLSICGISQANITRFKAHHGFATLGDLSIFKPKDCKDICDAYNHRRAEANKVGMVARRKMEALIYWLRDHNVRNIAVNFAEWNDAVMLITVENMEATNSEAEMPSAPIDVRCPED